MAGSEVRIIEVKARGGHGPIDGVPERELETMRAAGDAAWLYVLFNATQPGAYELFVVRNPGNTLMWTQTRAAVRTPDQPRGVRHEAAFMCRYEELVAVGEAVPLNGIEGLPEKV